MRRPLGWGHQSRQLCRFGSQRRKFRGVYCSARYQGRITHTEVLSDIGHDALVHYSQLSGRLRHLWTVAASDCDRSLLDRAIRLHVPHE